MDLAQTFTQAQTHTHDEAEIHIDDYLKEKNNYARSRSEYVSGNCVLPKIFAQLVLSTTSCPANGGGDILKETTPIRIEIAHQRLQVPSYRVLFNPAQIPSVFFTWSEYSITTELRAAIKGPRRSFRARFRVRCCAYNQRFLFAKEKNSLRYVARLHTKHGMKVSKLKVDRQKINY